MDTAPASDPRRRGPTRKTVGTFIAVLGLVVTLSACGAPLDPPEEDDPTTSTGQPADDEPAREEDAPSAPADEDPPVEAGQPAPDPATPITSVEPVQPPRPPTRPRPQAPSGNPAVAPGAPNTPPVVIPQEYDFSAPNSDPSITGTNGAMVYALWLGCDQTKTLLTTVARANDPLRVNDANFGLLGPRLPVLFTIGVVLRCGADKASAAPLWKFAHEQYGGRFLDRVGNPAAWDNDEDGIPDPRSTEPGYGEPECDLYRALAQTFTGARADEVGCDEDPEFNDPGFLDPVIPDTGFTGTVLPDYCRPAATAEWAYALTCRQIVEEALAGAVPTLIPRSFSVYGVPDEYLKPEEDDGDAVAAALVAPEPGVSVVGPATSEEPPVVSESVVEASLPDGVDAPPAEAPLSIEPDIAAESLPSEPAVAAVAGEPDTETADD